MEHDFLLHTGVGEALDGLLSEEDDLGIRSSLHIDGGAYNDGDEAADFLVADGGEEEADALAASTCVTAEAPERMDESGSATSSLPTEATTPKLDVVAKAPVPVPALAGLPLPPTPVGRPTPEPLLDPGAILEAARHRWFKNDEILDVLLHAREKYGLIPETKPAQAPGSGTVLLFQRVSGSKIRGFRVDGHEWRMKKNGRQLAETHEKLKVEGTPRVTCYYSQTLDGRCAPSWRLSLALSNP